MVNVESPILKNHGEGYTSTHSGTMRIEVQFEEEEKQMKKRKTISRKPSLFQRVSMFLSDRCFHWGLLIGAVLSAWIGYIIINLPKMH